ncbi:MAG: hypothetical protein IJH39_11980 [Clostridia bacterium]|nr:hypothetical protein [Clostridia bacterium]
MKSEENVPEYLYRGMCITYEDLKNFQFVGIDMELPYEPYIDEQGRKTVHDGNEYGIYMSDNPKVAQHAYGNSTNNSSGTYINPHIVIGGRNDSIMLPDVGVCYKISTQNLDVRKPWISDVLQGVYNNGWNGDEWIAEKIPAENYKVMQVMIGKDMLHDTQYIELDDIEHLREKTLEIMEQRKARLEVFAQDMSKIPEAKRKNFNLSHIGVLKEIYGENGFKYMNNFEKIDTSSNVGMIRYLMAKVYDKDRKNINFSLLAELENAKEFAQMYEKRGKEVDIKEILRTKRLIDLFEQSQKEKLESERVIDFYEKYGISHDEDWKNIKQKLSKESRIWMNKQSTTPDKEDLKQIEEELDIIDEALDIFNPKNEERRKEYDAKLEKQKKMENCEEDIQKVNTVKEDRKMGIITLEDISKNIKKHPVSLLHIKEAQEEIVNQIQAMEKERNIQDKNKRISKSPEDMER